MKNIILFFLFNLLYLSNAKNNIFESIKINPYEYTIYNNEIPADINCTIYRNGFGKFEGNNFEFNHLFDTLSLLIKIDINNKTIKFKSKLLESEYYNKSLYTIPPYRTLGGTFPNMSDIKKDEALINMMHDNLNANIIFYGNKLFAISDLAGHILINSNNLDYIEKYKFINDKINIITSTHPIQINNNIYNYEVDIITTEYLFYKIDINDEKMNKIYFYKLKTSNISYIHSFSIVENNIIFIEYPMYWNIKKILTNIIILPTLFWNSSSYTKINIINIETLNLETYNIFPLFSFHHINSFFLKDEIIIDLITYDSAEIFNKFYLKYIRNTNKLFGGHYTRIKINKINKNITIDINNSIEIEMPKINNKYYGKFYNNFYAIGNINNMSTIINYNTINNEIKFYNKKNIIPSEPLIYKNYIISIIYDTIIKKSYILIADSELNKINEIYLSISIPLSCHGFIINK